MKRPRIFDLLALTLLWCASLVAIGLIAGIAARLFMLGWGVTQ
jgi:hypothetical protein